MWTRVQLKEKAKQALNNNYWKVVLVSLLVGVIGCGAAATSSSINFNSNSTINGSTDIYGDSLFDDSFYYEDEAGISGDEAFDDDIGYSDLYENPNVSDAYWEGYYDGYFGNSQSDDTNDYLNGYKDGKLDEKAKNEFGEAFDNGVSDDVVDDFDLFEGFDDFDMGLLAGMAIVLFIILIIALIIGAAIALAYNAFIFNPLEVGTNRFFFKTLNEKAEIKEVAFAFDKNYKNVAKILFIRDLKILLWSLLFVIPGIIKSYEYLMMPYLLAENPNLTKEEAFRLSKQMMSGNKWNAFVLGLSFIGWNLLSGMTLGIVGIFYVEPYKNLTYAALYEELSAINGYPARAAAAQPNAENPYMQYNYYTQQQAPEYVQPESDEFEEAVVSQPEQAEYENTDVDELPEESAQNTLE